MRFLILGRSVGLKKAPPPQKKNQKESGTRRPGTPASLPWSLETTRCGYKINKVAVEVKSVFAKAMFIFQIKAGKNV